MIRKGRNSRLMTEPEFEAAFRQHKDAVYRFAWRLTSSAAIAEDITQDVFLILLRQPARFDRARGELRSFLFGVTRNLVLKKWREDGRTDVLDEETSVEPIDFSTHETAQIVGEAVSSLTPLQREVLILAEYEGLSIEEIAQVVQSQVGPVKARLHRARENLRRQLTPLTQMNGRNTV
jgi:RNA polymerase sigma-70 factor, ECF subfamily